MVFHSRVTVREQLLTRAAGVGQQVELPVEVEEGATSSLASISVLEVRQLALLLGGQVREAQPKREGLDPLAHLVDDVQLGPVERRHARTLVHLELGQSLGLEHPQRLTDRQPARPEVLGDLLLPDLAPRRDLPTEDRLAQVRRDALAGSLGPRRSLIHVTQCRRCAFGSITETCATQFSVLNG